MQRLHHVGQQASGGRHGEAAFFGEKMSEEKRPGEEGAWFEHLENNARDSGHRGGVGKQVPIRGEEGQRLHDGVLWQPLSGWENAKIERKEHVGHVCSILARKVTVDDEGNGAIGEHVVYRSATDA